MSQPQAFQREFQSLADRFRRTANRPAADADGNYYVKRVAADAARLTRRAVEAGELNLPIPPVICVSPVKIPDNLDDTVRRSLEWEATCSVLHSLFPDRVSGTVGCRRHNPPQQLAEGVVGYIGSTKTKDFAERGEDFACMCELLAELIDANTAVSRSTPAKTKNETPKADISFSSDRPTGKRNAWFLQWYEDKNEKTFHSHMAVRDKWNKMSFQERRAECPSHPNEITRAAVIKAVQRAQKDRQLKNQT